MVKKYILTKDELDEYLVLEHDSMNTSLSDIGEWLKAHEIGACDSCGLCDVYHVNGRSVHVCKRDGKLKYEDEYCSSYAKVVNDA